MENKLFPVFLKLEQIHLLIVGGGNVALEKLRAVVENSPATKIRLVSPQIKIETELYALRHNVDIIRDEFSPIYLQGIQLAIVATDNKAVSEAVKTSARPLNIFVNVADTPEACDFYLSSIVKKGDLKIAISTNGQSPTMAKRLKEVFEIHLPDELQNGIQQLNNFRNYLKGDFKSKVIELNKATEILLEGKKKSAPLNRKKTVFNFFMN